MRPIHSRSSRCCVTLTSTGSGLGSGYDLDVEAVAAACESEGFVVVGVSSDGISIAADASAAGAAGVRLIDVEVLADGGGTVWCLGTRDVSVGDGRRTVFVEAPAPGLGPDLVRDLCDDAINLVHRSGYCGAAVVSYAVDVSGSFERVAVDTVVSPHHATTEERTGHSLLGDRLAATLGHLLAPDRPGR